MRQLHYCWFILILLTGCASMGVAEPETFEQRLAYAYGVNTAIREASTDALNNGSISSDDMIYIMGVNDNLRLALDGARAASSVGDTDTAEARLLMTLSALTALQDYLRNAQ